MGEAGPTRNFIVRGADAAREGRRAAPAPCAAFVPGCGRPLVCVRASLRGGGGGAGGRGLPCRVLIGPPRGGGRARGRGLR